MTISRQTLLFIALIVLIIGVDLVGTYQVYTLPNPALNDFMSRWEGARSYWVEGLNPYGDEASLNIQERIFGRAALPDEDPGYFAYPFYMVFPLLPIVGMSYAWASAIWLVVLEVCLIGALLLLVNLFRWRPAPILLGMLFVWTLISYFPARGLLLGQPGLLIYFLEVLALWALVKRRDDIAGVALALSTMKPQMGYLIVPFLLLWALREKRWRFVGAFVISFGVLFGLSFLLLPSWLSDWFAQVSRYTSYTALGSPIWILAYLISPGIDPATGKLMGDASTGHIIELVLTGLCYLLMLWTWFGVLVQRKHERWLWTVVMTLVITHLVAPRTATPHYVIFVIPLVFYLRRLTRPKVRYGTLYALLVLVALFVFQWGHFLLTVHAKFEDPTVYLPTPFLFFALMLFTRQWWWPDEPPVP